MWDEIGRSSYNPIYTCMIRMILKSWYITWKGVQRKGDGKTYRKKIKKYDTKGRTPDSWLYYSNYADEIFISSTYNYPPKPSMIVTSFLKSG